MNILIASDSFKGSATSIEIADYIEKGILTADHTVNIQKVPIADGGEGTVRCVIQAVSGKLMSTKVAGPLGEPVNATWGLINDKTAIIEMAEAAGLTLINSGLDIGLATTYGVGQLIETALDYGAETIYIGLGGSATNDGGVGMAQALGAKFFDQADQELGHGVQCLKELARVDFSQMDPRIPKTNFIGLSDVNNPLTGPNGATAIFGPQKGATAEQIASLDQTLDNLAKIVKKQAGLDFMNTPGAGAAGGLGFGILTFCHGQIKSGIEEIINLVELDRKMANASLVITGEGQIDGQSLGGKVPIGVAHLAKKHHLPVVAVVGSIGSDISGVYEQGIDLILATTNSPMTVQTAVKRAPQLVEQAGMTVMKAIKLGQLV